MGMVSMPAQRKGRRFLKFVAGCGSIAAFIGSLSASTMVAATSSRLADSAVEFAVYLPSLYSDYTASRVAECRVYSAVDRDDDGIQEVERFFDINPYGLPMYSVVDSGADGAGDSYELWEYSCPGCVTRFYRGSHSTSITAIERWYQYNDRQYLIREDRDDNGDGEIEYNRTIYYDAEGRLVKVDHDDGADSVIDRSTKYYYNGSRRVLTEDLDGRGDIFRRILYEWSGDLLVRVLSYRSDQGAPSISIEHSYDKLDRLIRSDYYLGEQYYYHETYSYDSAGRLLRKEERFGDLVHDIWLYSYDLVGRLTKVIYRGATNTTVQTKSYFGKCPDVVELEVLP